MASMTDQQLINKLWNYCDILRDDGLSYGDYVEQLTFLLFLKMDDERVKLFKKKSDIPKEYNWQSLLEKDGAELEAHYIKILSKLGKQEGIIGVIFKKAQNKITDPAKLRKLIVDLIDKEEWLSLEVDVKGNAYEGLLERNAADVKGGAGQYFTPRPLINAIVNVMQPKKGMKIHDPACGTGGFLLSAYNYIAKRYKNLNRDEKEKLKHDTFTGNEIVPLAARLCVMNLYLHGVNGEETPISPDDSLKKNPGAIYDMVLTNPPFGKKSSEKIITAEGKAATQTLTVVRDDFWAQTSNKQLNFLQHVRSILKINGKAAIVMPDNVLFEGGAGETIRKKLLQTCDLHTVLRLPTGIFYAQGVKANVLFFDKKEGSKDVATKKVWIYDLRTNIHFTLKENTLKESDLDDFVKCYNPDNRHERKQTWSEKKNPDGRWRCFDIDEILKRDKTNLDIFWIKDESLEDIDSLPDPDVIANELVEELEAALEQLQEIVGDLK
jgi:type I restriction enzyme M protein